MSPTRWRNLCVVLGAVCIAQLWNDCRRDRDPLAIPDCSRTAPVSQPARSGAGSDRSAPHHDEPPPAAETAPGDDRTSDGLTVPPWALWFTPHPGEDLRTYRDRMLPVALAAIAPQRARVVRSRDSFATLAKLDARQRAELDGAAQDTSAALQERVMGAVLDGEVSPATWKPMAGVDLAHDLLEIVLRGNRRFLDSLDREQRARLAQHPFDFGDYLVFATPWEDALKLFD